MYPRIRIFYSLVESDNIQLVILEEYFHSSMCQSVKSTDRTIEPHGPPVIKIKSYGEKNKVVKSKGSITYLTLKINWRLIMFSLIIFSQFLFKIIQKIKMTILFLLKTTMESSRFHFPIRWIRLLCGSENYRIEDVMQNSPYMQNCAILH